MLRPDLSRSFVAGLLSLALLLLPALQAGQQMPVPAGVGAHPLLQAFCGRYSQALQDRVEGWLQAAEAAQSASEHCPQCFLQAVPPAPLAVLALSESRAAQHPAPLLGRPSNATVAARARDPPRLHYSA